MKKCTFKEKQLVLYFFSLDFKLSSNVHESSDHKKDVVQSYLSAFL